MIMFPKALPTRAQVEGRRPLALWQAHRAGGLLPAGSIIGLHGRAGHRALVHYSESSAKSPAQAYRDTQDGSVQVKFRLFRVTMIQRPDNLDL